ncbi:polysaccharide pyruvyl transferase family protein (plasmid) [Priestia aryabhattai]|uniref:polysaccharide pyruvyl transferase family protein n=1 Tax=Priestia aryabhattai TaxID=412384 RepID=UPI003D7FDD9D
MRILIHGFYGANNAGDDGILHSIIEQLYTLENNPKIVVSVRSKARKAYYGKHNIHTILGTDLDGLYKEVGQSDLIIIGGGGLLQDYTGFNPVNLFKGGKGAINYYSVPLIFAKMLNKKTMFYAIGIGPFHTREAASASSWLVELADIVTVRDKQSIKILEDIGCTKAVLSADPAVNLSSTINQLEFFSLEKLNLTQKKIVGINFRLWNFSENATENVYELLLEVSKYLIANHNAHILVIPFNKSLKEVELMEKFTNELPKGSSDIVYYNYSPAEFKGLCSQLDIMIAMRLHASIFSMGEGVPSIGVAYDPKVTEFFKELELDELTIPLKNVSVNKIINIAEDLLKNTPDWKGKVNLAFNKLKDREKANIKLLEQYLNIDSSGR